jgi:hypothetical protein
VIRDTRAREHGHLSVAAEDWRAFTVDLKVRTSG